MRLVVALLAVVAAATTTAALVPHDDGTVAAAAATDLATLPAGEGSVPEAGVLPDAEAELVADVQVEGVAVELGLEADAAASSGVEERPASEVRLVSAAPIAAVGGGAAVWHLRFFPWRRVLRAADWISALPFTGLFSRIEDSRLLENPVRERIAAFLEAHPGAGVQEIQEACDVAWGTTVYHLERLARAGHLVSHKDGRSHRYWLESDPEARNRRVAAVLKQDTPAAIAAAVQAEPGIHQGALCQRLEILPATASKYLKRLVDRGLVRVAPDAQRRLYYPTDSLEALVAQAPGQRA